MHAYNDNSGEATLPSPQSGGGVRCAERAVLYSYLNRGSLGCWVLPIVLDEQIGRQSRHAQSDAEPPAGQLFFLGRSTGILSCVPYPPYCPRRFLSCEIGCLKRHPNSPNSQSCYIPSFFSDTPLRLEIRSLASSHRLFNLITRHCSAFPLNFHCRLSDSFVWLSPLPADEARNHESGQLRAAQPILGGRESRPRCKTNRRQYHSGCMSPGYGRGFGVFRDLGPDINRSILWEK